MIDKNELKAGMKVIWMAYDKEYTYLCESPSGDGVILQHDGNWQQYKRWSTFLKKFEIKKNPGE